MSALASDPHYFKIGTTTACFMGAGNTVVASEALMIRASRGEKASMCCLTIDVGSGSSSHDFVADASTHQKVTHARTRRSAHPQLLACRQLAAEIDSGTALLSCL